MVCMAIIVLSLSMAALRFECNDRHFNSGYTNAEGN